MLTLSSSALRGLTFLYKYRFLTIAQFAKCANFSPYHAAEMLRTLERRNAVGYFGFTSIPGAGKTPKVYYLKRKGFDILQEETDDKLLFREVQADTVWTPRMYH